VKGVWWVSRKGGKAQRGWVLRKVRARRGIDGAVVGPVWAGVNVPRGLPTVKTVGNPYDVPTGQFVAKADKAERDYSAPGLGFESSKCRRLKKTVASRSAMQSKKKMTIFGKTTFVETVDNIRNSLISKLLQIKDQDILSALDKLVSASSGDAKVDLTAEQLEMLKMGNEDFENGKVISQSELFERERKWLGER
jgi:hypothetical protein